MPLPDFEILTDELFAKCDEAVGDSIMYKPTAGVFTSLKAWVDFGEALRDVGSNIVIDNEITVQLLKSVHATKPIDSDRIVFGPLPNDEFKPINVRDTMRDWTFGVERV